MGPTMFFLITWGKMSGKWEIIDEGFSTSEEAKSYMKENELKNYRIVEG